MATQLTDHQSALTCTLENSLHEIGTEFKRLNYEIYDLTSSSRRPAAKLVERNAGLGEQLEELREKLYKSRQISADRGDKIEVLQEKLEGLSSASELLERNIELVNERESWSSKYDDAFKRLNQEITAAARMRKSSRNEVEFLKHTVKGLQKTRNELTERIVTFEADVEVASVAWKSLEATNQNLLTAKYDLQEKLDSALLKQLSDDHGEFKRLNQKVSTAYSERDEAQLQIEFFEDKVGGLQKKLDDALERLRKIQEYADRILGA